jgi:hypothetical protein
LIALALQSWWPYTWAGLAPPDSSSRRSSFLVGTFVLFPVFDFPSIRFLFGLVLAIGLAVDDAFVWLRVVRHIEEGMTPKTRR